MDAGSCMGFWFQPVDACRWLALFGGLCAAGAARVFRRGQERRFCMIRGESDSDQKMASEADLDIVELLCGLVLFGKC